MKIKAVIFDMDGTMFDTESLTLQAWDYLGNKYGYKDARSAAMKAIGASKEENERIFLERLGKNIPYQQHLKEIEDYVYNYIENNGVPIKNGLLEILEYLNSKKIKMALASSTEQKRVIKYLKTAGLEGYFTAILCGGMVKNDKPEPDIFIEVARQLGMKPEECLVIEDSFKGVEAAYRAGCKTIMVPDIMKPDERIKSMAYKICNSLLEVMELHEIREVENE